MPLTEQEKREFLEILSYMSSDDIISLARTIIKDQVKIINDEEAKNAILTYTFDANELFRRKKLKKEMLFQYLYNKKVDDIMPSSEKTALVKRILRFWGSEETFELMEDEDVDLPCLMASQRNALLPQELNMHNCWVDESLWPSIIDREFASEFCRWFYVLLNGAINSSNSSGPAFNKSHFFEECKMVFLIKHSDNISVDSCEGATEVSSRLLKLVVEEGVLFNPNLSEKGIQVMCDQFGRKVIIVAGTVHCRESIGIFEQHFGLVRDPTSDFAWKIKFTRVSFLIGGSLQNPFEPILDFTKNMLT